jgi:hypothetical protein
MSAADLKCASGFATVDPNGMSWRGTWGIPGIYKYGDAVEYSGSTYVCNSKSGSVVIAPDASGAPWEVIGGGGGGAVDQWATFPAVADVDASGFTVTSTTFATVPDISDHRVSIVGPDVIFGTPAQGQYAITEAADESKISIVDLLSGNKGLSILSGGNASVSGSVTAVGLVSDNDITCNAGIVTLGPSVPLYLDASANGQLYRDPMAGPNGTTLLVDTDRMALGVGISKQVLLEGDYLTSQFLVVGPSFTTSQSINASPIAVDASGTTTLFTFPTKAAQYEVRSYQFAIGFTDGGANQFSVTATASQFWYTVDDSKLSLSVEVASVPGGITFIDGGNDAGHTLEITTTGTTGALDAYLTYTILGSGNV